MSRVGNIRLLIARVPYLAHVPRPMADALVWNAQRGMQMFYAVSGFLITSTALRKWNSISGINVRDFTSCALPESLRCCS